MKYNYFLMEDPFKASAREHFQGAPENPNESYGVRVHTKFVLELPCNLPFEPEILLELVLKKDHILSKF